MTDRKSERSASPKGQIFYPYFAEGEVCEVCVFLPDTRAVGYNTL